MAANRKNNPTKAAKPAERSSRQNILLALTLVPIIAGVVLIIAWAIDWELAGDLENQHFLGLLFILAGFAFSNLVQQKWVVFTGWALVTLADFLLLTGRSDNLAIVSLVIAGIGLLLLAFEFYRQFQKNHKTG